MISICDTCGKEFVSKRITNTCPDCMKEEKMELGTAICPKCGKEFKKIRHNQVFCSTKCRKQRIYTSNKIYNVVCVICGKEFQSKSKYAKYCSKYCKNENKKLMCGSEGPNRSYTELTIYLIHKYSMEGMSENQIAKLLKRNPEFVRKILDMPISSYQLICINKNLNPYKAKTNRRRDKNDV